MARANQKNGFFIQDGFLYRHGQVNGEKVTRLCLPSRRISIVSKIAHDMPFGSHMAFRHIHDRIAMSFFFSVQKARVKNYFMRCETIVRSCQKKRLERDQTNTTRCASCWSFYIRLYCIDCIHSVDLVVTHMILL